MIAPLAILNPATRALGPVFFAPLQGAVLGAPPPSRRAWCSCGRISPGSSPRWSWRSRSPTCCSSVRKCGR